MKKFIFVFAASLILSLGAVAQSTTTPQTTAAASTTEAKPKKQIFRATKDQIMQVQKMLKGNGLYAGEATGKMEDDFRSAIKSWQGDNGLKKTGTLNRATLEKMGIELTTAQKAIPASPNSYASTSAEKSSTASTSAKVAATASTETASKKPPVFRATKDQIIAAQKLLKEKTLYSGEETGKLDDATRDALKKYQEATALKVTGTLNKATLEKMGIALTDKQREH